MSILATIFATVLITYSLCVSKGFFSCFAASQNFLAVVQVEKKQAFYERLRKKISNSDLYSWNSSNFACKQKTIPKILPF